MPLRSSWTNKLITSKDHASVQLNIGHLNEEGVYQTGQYTTFALTGAVRTQVPTHWQLEGGGRWPPPGAASGEEGSGHSLWFGSWGTV